MHALDSNLVRFILGGVDADLFTVHDMFAIKLTEAHILLDLVNKYYEDRVPKPKQYSPIILI